MTDDDIIPPPLDCTRCGQPITDTAPGEWTDAGWTHLTCPTDPDKETD